MVICLVLISFLNAQEALGPELSPTQIAALASENVIVEEALSSEKIVVDRKGEKIILSNGYVFRLTDPQYHEYKHHLVDLNPQDLEKFLALRRKKIIQWAKVLSFSGLSSGIGYVEANAISMIKDGTGTGNPLDALSEFEAALEKMDLTQTEKKSYRQAFIAKILRTLDNHIFQKSKSLVGGKAYFIDLALAPMSVLGFGNKMVGGMIGLNIIMGYDTQTKRFIFQVKRIFEKAKVGAAFIPLGVNARIGGFVRSSSYAPNTYDVTYPPGVPMFRIKANGINGGGFSAPITLLTILTGGWFAAAENFMTFNGPSHSVTLLDRGFSISFKNINDFINDLKYKLRFKSYRCQNVFS